jgi:hypothetical protein
MTCVMTKYVHLHNCHQLLPSSKKVTPFIQRGIKENLVMSEALFCTSLNFISDCNS